MPGTRDVALWRLRRLTGCTFTGSRPVCGRIVRWSSEDDAPRDEGAGFHIEFKGNPRILYENTPVKPDPAKIGLARRGGYITPGRSDKVLPCGWLRRFAVAGTDFWRECRWTGGSSTDEFGTRWLPSRRLEIPATIQTSKWIHEDA
jgi:hypothetical protein